MELKAALQKMEADAQEVQATIADCKPIGADSHALEAEFQKAIALFHAGWLKGLKVVGHALLVDRVNILHHVENMVSDYQNKDFNGIGSEFGQILREILDDSTVNQLEISKPDQSVKEKVFFSPNEENGCGYQEFGCYGNCQDDN